MRRLLQSAGTSDPLLILLGALLSCLLAALSRLPVRESSVPSYLLLIGLAFSVYGASALRVTRSERGGLATVILFAILLRVILVPAPANRSSDVYRYLWEGRMVRHGINPLLHPPDDPGLASLRSRTWGRVNNRSVPSVYPTVSQAVFALADRVRPGSVTAWKAILCVFDFGSVLLLAGWLKSRGDRPERSILFAWNPLVLAEFALNGHQDAIGIALLIAACWCADSFRKPHSQSSCLSDARLHRGDALAPPMLSAALLAVSTLAKGYTLVLAPFLAFRTARPWRYLTTYGLALAFGLLPLFWGWHPGVTPPWKGLTLYSTLWARNGPLYDLLLKLTGWSGQSHPETVRLLCGLLTLSLWLLLVCVFRRGNSPGARTLASGATALGVALLCSPTVYPWYVAWLLPLAIIARQPEWVFLSGLVNLDYLHAYLGAESPAVLYLEYAPLLIFFAWKRIRWPLAALRRSRCPENPAATHEAPVILDPARVSVIIPALNEESAIGAVISEIPRRLNAHCIVVDNGSEDRTAEVAASCGAEVVWEKERGYGSACLAGIALLPKCDIVVFLDGDHSDCPEEMPLLIEPIRQGAADLVIGSRMLGRREPGALPPHSLFGNWLAGLLLRFLYGQPTTDLGPFRAIRRDVLDRLGMKDRSYGWTVEMQVKAAQRGLRVVEVPVSYRRRIGRSKITGSITASVRAGWTILAILGREWLRF